MLAVECVDQRFPRTAVDLHEHPPALDAHRVQAQVVLQRLAQRLAAADVVIGGGIAPGRVAHGVGQIGAMMELGIRSLSKITWRSAKRRPSSVFTMRSR
jgi:hypothetical protein